MQFKRMRKEQCFQVLQILFYFLMWHWLVVTPYVGTSKIKIVGAWVVLVRTACYDVAWKNGSLSAILADHQCTTCSLSQHSIQTFSHSRPHSIGLSMWPSNLFYNSVLNDFVAEKHDYFSVVYDNYYYNYKSIITGLKDWLGWGSKMKCSVHSVFTKPVYPCCLRSLPILMQNLWAGSECF